MAIQEKALGSEHPEVAETPVELARLLRELGRDAEAEQMEGRVRAILAKDVGEESEPVRCGTLVCRNDVPVLKSIVS